MGEITSLSPSGSQGTKPTVSYKVQDSVFMIQKPQLLPDCNFWKSLLIKESSLVKKVKGLRSTDWQLQTSHWDVKYSIGHRVNNIVNNYVWCQVCTGNIGGSLLCKVYDV